MQHLKHVLVVEDSLSLARIYKHYLQSDGYQVDHVETLEECYQFIRDKKTDIILLDIMLPDGNGIKILKDIQKDNRNIAVIVMTAYGTIQSAIEAMRAGAYDFLLKPFHAEKLLMTVSSAFECISLQQDDRDYEESENDILKSFIGESAPMQVLYRSLKNAARSNAPLFICGDSGTGKELCARSAHNMSIRKDKPFIAINCAAIPHELMESEIFGHVKGAFTGAQVNRKGAAEMADGGTLFLDEITEMNSDMQAKLLRFLQNNTFRKLGSSRMEKVDIRIMCATNRDPLAYVASKRMREDLYYRLHVIPIYVPLLKERGDDIIHIAQSYLRQYSNEEKKKFSRISDDVKQAFRHYSWPGNVRELQNAIRQAVVMHDGLVLEKDMLPDSIFSVRNIKNHEDIILQEPQASDHKITNRATDQIVPLNKVEEKAIKRALEICDGNVSRAASRLRVSPSTLYRKMQTWKKEA